jgi:hypothetical protein
LRNAYRVAALWSAAADRCPREVGGGPFDGQGVQVPSALDVVDGEVRELLQRRGRTPAQ